MSDDGDVAIKLRLTAPFCHMIAFLQSETIGWSARCPASAPSP